MTSTLRRSLTWSRPLAAPCQLTVTVCRHAQFATKARPPRAPQSPPQPALNDAASSSAPVAASPESQSQPPFRLRPMPAHRRHLKAWHYDVHRPLEAQPANTSEQARTNPDGSPITVHFRIKRTASMQLPVYLQSVGAKGTAVVTRIRNIDGNIRELAREVQILLGPQAHVQARVGRVHVKGNYVKPIKQWIEQMGF